MRKLELKFWCFFVAFLAMLLVMTSCKTKQLDVVKTETKKESGTTSKTDIDNKTKVQTESEIREKEMKEMMALLSSLDINFNGKSLDDKLDVLLNRTPEGVKMSIAGMGTANYKEEYKYDFSSFKKEVFKRQDSLFNQLRFDLIESQEFAFEKYFNKTKDVKVTGGQTGLYISLTIIAIVLIILAWIAKRFKLFEVKKPPDFK